MVALGVDKEYFLALQLKIIKESTPKVLTSLFEENPLHSLQHRANTVAKVFQSSRVLLESLQLAVENKLSVGQDPFFRALIKNRSLNTFLHLRKKSHLLVEKSCVLIGVPDPTGILLPGEIFC